MKGGWVVPAILSLSLMPGFLAPLRAQMPGNDPVTEEELLFFEIPTVVTASRLEQPLTEIAPNLPVVLASAYATEEAEAEARSYGVSAVLTKPLDLQKVLSFLSLLQREESILVVDDDPNFSRTLKDILQARGYRVKTEADPGRTLDDMAESYKLVVLLDLNLGQVNGLDVLKEIRAKYPTKPVVLVTGYRDEMSDSIRKGLQIGAYACLYKPLEIERLIGLIEGVSGQKARSLLEGGISR